MEPKYPNIEVQLSGEDGNAMMIIGSVRRALKRGPREMQLDPPTTISSEVKAFTDEATSGNYDNVLQTCMRWVTCN